MFFTKWKENILCGDHVFPSFSPSACNLVTKPFVGFSWKWVWEFITKSCWVSISFVKIGTVTVILCLRAQINFYPWFLYFLTDLDDVHCRGSPHNEQLWVLWKLLQWKSYFTNGHKLIYLHALDIYCSILVKLCT